MNLRFYFNENNPLDKKVESFIRNISKDFLTNLENSVIDEFLDVECDNPFEYREKTLTSFFFPALLSNSKGALMELVYEKKSKNFLDFYALDKSGTCSYLIEFKQRFWKKTNKDVSAKLATKWEEVNSQIKKLTKKAVTTCIDTGKTIYGISYLVVPVLSPLERENKETRKMVLDSINNHETLKDYDWMTIYEIPTEPYDLSFNPYDEDKSKYSHVLLIGKVKKIQD